MPRPLNSTILARLGEAFDDLLASALAALLPQPEAKPISVRVRERR